VIRAVLTNETTLDLGFIVGRKSSNLTFSGSIRLDFHMRTQIVSTLGSGVGLECGTVMSLETF
jgi:hypothetical protein